MQEMNSKNLAICHNTNIKYTQYTHIIKNHISVYVFGECYPFIKTKGIFLNLLLAVKF